MAAITAATTFAHEAPLHIIILVGLAAAALMYLLMAAHAVRQGLASPKYKILVESMLPEDWLENGQRHFRPRLLFRSLANFPIEIDVKDIEWECGGSRGEQLAVNQTSAFVPPLGAQYLRGPRFVRRSIEGQDQNSFERVSVKVRLRYGRAGKLKFAHDQDYIMPIYFGREGFRETSLEQQGRGRHA